MKFLKFMCRLFKLYIFFMLEKFAIEGLISGSYFLVPRFWPFLLNYYVNIIHIIHSKCKNISKCRRIQKECKNGRQFKKIRFLWCYFYHFSSANKLGYHFHILCRFYFNFIASCCLVVQLLRVLVEASSLRL